MTTGKINQVTCYDRDAIVCGDARKTRHRGGAGNRDPRAKRSSKRGSFISFFVCSTETESVTRRDDFASPTSSWGKGIVRSQIRGQNTQSAHGEQSPSRHNTLWWLRESSKDFVVPDSPPRLACFFFLFLHFFL